jgi:hypothetical protein
VNLGPTIFFLRWRRQGLAGGGFGCPTGGRGPGVASHSQYGQFPYTHPQQQAVAIKIAQVLAAAIAQLQQPCPELASILTSDSLPRSSSKPWAEFPYWGTFQHGSSSHWCPHRWARRFFSHCTYCNSPAPRNALSQPDICSLIDRTSRLPPCQRKSAFHPSLYC